jgi:hypothetical protein
MYQSSSNSILQDNHFAKVPAAEVDVIHIDSFVDIELRNCDPGAAFQEPFILAETSESQIKLRV